MRTIILFIVLFSFVHSQNVANKEVNKVVKTIIEKLQSNHPKIIGGNNSPYFLKNSRLYKEIEDKNVQEYLRQHFSEVSTDLQPYIILLFGEYGCRDSIPFVIEQLKYGGRNAFSATAALFLLTWNDDFAGIRYHKARSNKKHPGKFYYYAKTWWNANGPYLYRNRKREYPSPRFKLQKEAKEKKILVDEETGNLLWDASPDDMKMTIDISDDVYYYDEYPRNISSIYKKELLLQFSPNSFDLHDELGYLYLDIPEYIEKSIYHQQEALRLLKESKTHFAGVDNDENKILQQITIEIISSRLEIAIKIESNNKQQETERTKSRLIFYLEEYIQLSNDEWVLEIVKWLSVRKKEGF